MSEEKVIRFSAEDGNFNEKVQRMGETFKQSFSGGELNDILSKAEKQFDNINDKIKFLQENLERIKQLRNDQRKLETEEINKETDPARRASMMQQMNERYQSNVANFATGKPFYEFVEQVKRLVNNLEQQRVEEKRDENGLNEKVNGTPPPIIPPEDKERISSNFKDMGNNISNILNGGITRSLGMYSAALAALITLTKKGYDDLRSENNIRRKLDITDDFADSSFLSRLDMGRSDFRDLALRTANSRRSGFDLQRQTLTRALLGRGYGLEEGEIAGFDQFYRAGKNGINLTDVNSLSDPTRIIAEILTRSERTGILGVKGEDFTMLPEKIAQVQNVMSMQYQSGENTDATTAINLMIAGQGIGGRFADNRFGDVMGRINSSIQNPGNPGMRAMVFELLRRNNPNLGYTDILGQMENGASADNLKSILPSIANLPQGELRRMVLFQFTKNMQDAIRLDGAGNLQNMLKSLDQKPLSDKEFESQIGKASGRNDVTTTEWDRSLTAIKNSTGNIANNTAQIVDFIMKNPPSTWLPAGKTPDGKNSTLYNEYYKKNVLQSGSPTGEQIK